MEMRLEGKNGSLSGHCRPFITKVLKCGSRRELWTTPSRLHHFEPVIGFLYWVIWSQWPNSELFRFLAFFALLVWNTGSWLQEQVQNILYRLLKPRAGTKYPRAGSKYFVPAPGAKSRYFTSYQGCRFKTNSASFAFQTRREKRLETRKKLEQLPCEQFLQGFEYIPKKIVRNTYTKKCEKSYSSIIQQINRFWFLGNVMRITKNESCWSKKTVYWITDLQLAYLQPCSTPDFSQVFFFFSLELPSAPLNFSCVPCGKNKLHTTRRSFTLDNF